MKHSDAVQFLSHLDLDRNDLQWADLGAGSGTFTLALSELLGASGVVHAKDISKPLGFAELDGMLLANSLHYIKNQRKLLGELMLNIKTGGRIAIIEYDIHRGNFAVPHPVSFEKLGILTEQIGLPQPTKLATYPSRYHKEMYLATIAIPEQLELLD